MELVVGADIEEISRFEGLSAKKNRLFLSKIFTKAELDYCFSKRHPAQHLAGRFAAKEAVTKALSDRGLVKATLRQIEIIRKKNGAPKVKLSPCIKVGMSISVSISHEKSHAVAFAIVFFKNVHKNLNRKSGRMNSKRKIKLPSRYKPN